MLFEDPTTLEKYVKKSQNKELLIWWAQYRESCSDFDTAMQFYAAAGDVHSQVRIFCFSDRVDKVGGGVLCVSGMCVLCCVLCCVVLCCVVLCSYALVFEK